MFVVSPVTSQINWISLASGLPRTTSLLADGLPHPSVVWYQVGHEPIVGRAAKNNVLGFAEAPGNFFVSSIKRSLGKGTPVLLAALAAIRAAAPGVRFVFAGKGDVAPEAAPDVRVLGSVPHDVLFALYRAADVVVAPSVWPEPLSRVILEAMALGRPVVATSVGGNPELVEDGVTGLLVPRGDAPALARAVTSLLHDPARRARMGEAAARRAAQVFDEERLVAELLDAYESALVPSP